MNIFVATIIGYLAGFTGILIGIILSMLTSKKGKRFQATILGFLAGLMLAVICFDILPEAFLRGGLYIGVVGICIGVLTAFILDSRISHSYPVDGSVRTRSMRMALLMVIAMALHNIPEGLAIGSLLDISIRAGIRLAIIIALHCIPEGVAVAIPLKNAKVSGSMLMMSAFLFGIPMGLGSAIGFIISEISKIFVTIALGFAAGMMMYMTCGEMIPESKEMWKGRMTTIGAMLGLIVGILITGNI